tara:strand:+ start:476 stop:2644 length:2169 start_codon:yes stop_codon:yes gene_type:complete
MSLTDLVLEFKNNPEFVVSSETISPFVDGPEFFDEFLPSTGKSSAATIKKSIYESEDNLLKLFSYTEDDFVKYLQKKYKTLDHIKRNYALSTGLGVDDSTVSMAKAFVEHGFYSPEIPDDHDISKNAGSMYVNRSVMAEDQIKFNIQKYLKNEEILTIDDVKVDGALATALGVEKNGTDIAKALVEQEYLSSEIPDNYDLGLRNGSLFIKKEFVGETQFIKNIQKYVNETYKTLDYVIANQALATALEVDNSGNAIAKALVDQRFISPEIPDGHKLSKGGHSSFYIDDQVLSLDEIKNNVKKYVTQTYPTIRELHYDFALASALNSFFIEGEDKLREGQVSNLRAKIVELGWLDPDNFRPYLNSELPANFENESIVSVSTTTPNKVRNKKISSGTKTTTFIKGEAFEQLVGLMLSYSSPDELILPQYCLDVQENHFGTRADFKVGNTIYEVKWGNAKDNIEETAAKHLDLIDGRNLGLGYSLIRLEDQLDIPTPSSSFASILDKDISDEEVRERYGKLADIITEASEENGVKNVEFLTHFRDHVYNVVDTANQKEGEERQQYIVEQLEKLTSFDGKEDLDQYMESNINRFFASREAVFEFEGQIYRGMISPKQFRDEQQDRLKTIYYFGDVAFENELDRNIGIMIELSPDHENLRMENTLTDPNLRQRHPLFSLPGGTNISTNGHKDSTKINSLDEVKSLLNISDDMYDFGLRYIKSEVSGR